MNQFSFKKKFFFVIFFFLIFILIIEISLRLLHIEYPIFQKHDEIRGFSLLPNSSGTWSREGEGKVSINSVGLRDFEHSINKPLNNFRIAILGDSFAEARSVDIDKTFWFKLKNDLKFCKKLHFEKNIEIINFGITEYGTTQQYLTLQKIWKYDPDIILLAFFSGNDIADNYKSLSRKKYRPYFQFNKKNEVEVDDSFLDSKPYKILSSFPGRIFIRVSQYSRIAQLFREAYVQSYFKKQNQKNQTQSKENLKKIKKNSSNLYNPINSNWSKAWDITEKILLMISKEVKNKDKDFILVSLSNPIQVNPKKQIVSQYKEKNNIEDIFYPENRLKDLAMKNSIKYVPLAKKMSAIASEEKIYFHGFTNTILGEGHWNETGHEYASKLISRDICNLY